MTESLKYKTGSKGRECDYITKNGVFNYLWMNGELSYDHRNFIFEKYPKLNEIQKCIKEFREIFKHKRIPLLYLFIDTNMDS